MTVATLPEPTALRTVPSRGKLPNRHLYTGDCTYLFADPDVYNPDGGPYTAKVIHDHIDQLADAGIDTYLCNPQGQGNWWPSKRVPNIFEGYQRGDRAFVMTHAKCVFWNLKAVPQDTLDSWADGQTAFLDRYLDLQEAGVDWVAECVAACRRRGIAPWVTIRMNDTHGRNIVGNEGEPDSYFNAPLFANPDNRLAPTWMKQVGGGDTCAVGMDYAREEVRAFVLATVRELVEDYDIEGLELDWLRRPQCCPPNADAAAIARMTDFHAEIRKITHAKARATGRRFALGMRVPASWDVMRSVGIDVPAIAQQGLVDFISPSNFWQAAWDLPYGDYRAAVGKDVTLYGVVECGGNGLMCWAPDTETKDFRRQPVAPELMRGNAAGKLALGVDGIEHFNLFCADSRAGAAVSHYDELQELTSLVKLRGLPKQYLLSNKFGHCWLPPFEQSEQLPAILEPRWRRLFRISMCAEPATEDLELVVQVVTEREDDEICLGVRFNHCWPDFSGQPTQELLFPVGPLKAHAPEHRAWNYRFPVTAIREGWNEIELFHPGKHRLSRDEQRAQRVCVLSLELAVVFVDDAEMNDRNEGLG